MKNAVKNNEQFIRNENRVNEVMKNRRFYLAEQLKYKSRNLSHHVYSVPDTYFREKQIYDEHSV